MPGNGSPLSSHTNPLFPKYGWMYLAIQKCSKDVSIHRCQTHLGARTKEKGSTMVFRQRVLLWTWEDAEQSCRSVSPWQNRPVLQISESNKFV